jgi:hypothetical protein
MIRSTPKTMWWIAVLSVALAFTLVAPWAAAGLESVLQQRVARRTAAVLARAGVALNERDGAPDEAVTVGANRSLDVHETGSLGERGRDREEA